jgi:DNA-binding protein
LDDSKAAIPVHARGRAIGNAVDEVLILNGQRLGKGNEW